MGEEMSMTKNLTSRAGDGEPPICPWCGREVGDPDSWPCAFETYTETQRGFTVTPHPPEFREALDDMESGRVDDLTDEDFKDKN